ncbi:MAG: PIG-L family deacetylase [Candidatus Lokiarchaeota archaeon]|nr:PIG-L family deacetylase [Candidatus Harpocratesius repetitus]
MNQKKFLFICAHPDDLEFNIGYLIFCLGHKNIKGIGKEFIFSIKKGYPSPAQRSVSVRIISMTRGEMSDYTLITKSTKRAAEVRTAELIKAMNYLGISENEISFLGCFDGDIRVTDRNIEKLKREIITFQPDYVIAPEPVFTWYFHQDHRKTGKIAYWAIQRLISERKNPKKILKSSNVDKIPALYFYSSLFHHFYFPKYPSFQISVNNALQAHYSQKELLFGKGVKMDKITTTIHGWHVSNHKYAQALRRQFISGRDPLSAKFKLDKKNTLWRKLLYILGVKIVYSYTIPELESKRKFFDGTLPPS